MVPTKNPPTPRAASSPPPWAFLGLLGVLSLVLVWKPGMPTGFPPVIHAFEEDSTAEAVLPRTRESLADAIREAKERNSLILVMFSQDSDNVIPGQILEDPVVGDLIRDYFVLLVAHPRSEEPHKPRIERDPKTRRKRPICPYFGIDCKIHEQIAEDLGKKFRPRRTPCEYVITFRKKVLHDGNKNPIDFDTFSPDIYRKAFIEMVRKFRRKPVALEQYEWLRSARKGLESRDYASGVPPYLKLKKHLEKFPLVMRQAIREVGDSYEARARELYKIVKDRSESDPEGALAEIEKLIDQFDGLEISIHMRQLRAHLKKP